MPPIIHGLLRDLPLRPAYVLNLRWDVLAWNPAADRLFGFSQLPAERRNLLWMLFMEPHLRTLLCPWEDQAQQMLSSFRRDYVHAQAESDVTHLVRALEQLQALILPAFIARPLLRHYPSPRHKLTRACHIYLGLLTG